MTSERFPREASDVKLLIPDDYDPHHSNKPGKCYFKFDIERELFLLVSEETDDILDIIDTRDIVGAAIDIGFSSSSEDLRSHSNQRHQNEPASDEPNDTQAAAVLEIYVYPRQDPSEKTIFSSCGLKSTKFKPKKVYAVPADLPKLDPRHAQHRRFQIAPAEDLGGASILVDAIRRISRPDCKKNDRLLVIVNPFSGTKQGETVFNTIVAPLFEQAGINYDHCITQHARHALERMAKQESDSSMPDISEYDGIVAIGGDGIIYEVLQGIYKRSDCDQILSKLKLGTIGSGTSNGLAKSIAHSSKEQASPLDYAFLVAKGRTAKMDLSKYETESSSYLSFLTFSWSMIADIDIESEVIRFMGFLRMDVWAVWRVLNLRKYRAKFSYLKPSQEKQSSNECPPLDTPIPNDSGWTSYEDDFILFWASQVTHAAENTFQSPNSKLNDGLFEIFIVRGNVSRFRLAMILLAMETGGHKSMPGVEFVKCTAYRLEPLTKGSFNDLDGEVIEEGRVQGRVLPGAIQVYCRPS